MVRQKENYVHCILLQKVQYLLEMCPSKSHLKVSVAGVINSNTLRVQEHNIAVSYVSQWWVEA